MCLCLRLFSDSTEKHFSHSQPDFPISTTPRKSETPLQRMKRVCGAQRTPGAPPRPPTPSIGVPVSTASRFSAGTSPLRATDSPQPRQSKRIATPRPKVHLTPGGNVSMVSPPVFSVGTAPPRRAETPLQRHNRVNGTHSSTTEANPLRPFQCVDAARPPRIPSEPFLSPSFRPRFPVAVRSARPAVSSAKAKLDFSEEKHSTFAAPKAPAPTTKNRAATRQGNPRLEMLGRQIQLCIDQGRWHDAMRVIEAVLQLDPESSLLQTQKALAHNHILVAKRRQEAEAAVKRQRDAERAQRAQQARRETEKSCCRTFYDVLDVRSSATGDEIKSSFRVLARQYHPDKNQNATRDDEIKCITEAYRVLSDAAQRRNYDASLRTKRLWR